MIDELDHLANDICALNSKLVLLIGPPGSGKSALLGRLSVRREVQVLHVGAVLGRRLLAVPSTQRHLQAADILRELIDETARGELLLLDNIEILFDRTLRLSPVRLLKQCARSRRVVAVWPGELRENRLTYAVAGHPEHQDDGADGLVPFEVC